MYKVNLTKLWNDAFGYSPPVELNIDKAPARIENSKLGTKYYGTDSLGREHFMPVWINGFLMPFAIISTVVKKTIVETPMVERAGTVKELISIDDYEFSLKGILIDNSFPDDQITQWHDIFKIGKCVQLRSAITDIFLKGNSNDSGKTSFDHTVVIYDISFPAVAAVENCRAVEMKLKSDNIFQLTY